MGCFYLKSQRILRTSNNLFLQPLAGREFLPYTVNPGWAEPSPEEREAAAQDGAKPRRGQGLLGAWPASLAAAVPAQFPTPGLKAWDGQMGALPVPSQS